MGIIGGRDGIRNMVTDRWIDDERFGNFLL